LELTTSTADKYKLQDNVQTYQGRASVLHQAVYLVVTEKNVMSAPS